MQTVEEGGNKVVENYKLLPMVSRKRGYYYGEERIVEEEANGQLRQQRAGEIKRNNTY